MTSQVASQVAGQVAALQKYMFFFADAPVLLATIAPKPETIAPKPVPIAPKPVPIVATTDTIAPKPVPEPPFRPVQEDSLFACFYALLHGFAQYELHKAKFFCTEKQAKFAAAELLKMHAADLKANKISHHAVEDELVNQRKITLQSLGALCIIYKLNIKTSIL